MAEHGGERQILPVRNGTNWNYKKSGSPCGVILSASGRDKIRAVAGDSMKDHIEDDTIHAEVAELIKRAKKLPSHAQLDLIGLILASQTDADEEAGEDEEVDTGIESESQEFSLSFDDCLQLSIRWQPELVRELMAGIDFVQEVRREFDESGQEKPELTAEVNPYPLSETRCLYTHRHWMILPNGERRMVNQIHERLSSKVLPEVESEWMARASRAEKRFSSEFPGHFIDTLTSLVGISFLLEEPITAETRNEIMRLFDPALSTYYKKPKVGSPRKWNKEILEQTIKQAASKIQKPHLITLPRLAEIINKHELHSDRVTADSLSKLLKRYGIDWRTLKKELQKRT